MELFAHAVSKPAFYQTVMGAKRWGAKDALQEGLIVEACSMETLFEKSVSPHAVSPHHKSIARSGT